MLDHIELYTISVLYKSGFGVSETAGTVVGTLVKGALGAENGSCSAYRRRFGGAILPTSCLIPSLPPREGTRVVGWHLAFIKVPNKHQTVERFPSSRRFERTPEHTPPSF